MTLFFITAVFILILMYGYSGYRVIVPLPLGTRWKIGLWAILLLGFSALIYTVTARHRPGLQVIPQLSWAAYICFGFITLVFPWIVIKDICVGLYLLAHTLFFKFKKQKKPENSICPGMDPSRRRFIYNAGNTALVGAACALAGYGVVRAVSGPDVVRVNISIPGLPESFHGFTILQISDLHISSTIKETYVRNVVAQISREPADMIVFTGDLADGSADDLGGDARPLADLDAPFGKFFVTGNHDYYSGVDQWLAHVKRLGFTPLINQHRIIEKEGGRMVLAGITDYRADRIKSDHKSDPGKALKGASSSLPVIMLAHQPKSIFQAAAHKVDLMLCGHTHGGQYVPWNFMVPLDQPYVQGLYRHKNTLVYVNRGTGYWGPPMRIGAPPEITRLCLTGHA